MIKLALALLVPVAAALPWPEYSSPSLGYLPSSMSHLSTGFSPGIFNQGLNQGLHQGLNQRQVYFFAAPDDYEAARLRVYIQPSGRRNAKIIFIKAPGSGNVIPEVVAPSSQAAERTLVYVLVKKSQHGGAITLPASLGVKQGKPEVYFIKYQNGHEANAAVQQGLHGATVGSALEDLGSHQSFIGSLNTGGVGNTGFTGTSGLISGGPIGIDQGFNINTLGGTRYGTPTGSGPYK